MGTLDSTNIDTSNSDALGDFSFSEEQLRQAAQALDNGEDAVEFNAEPGDGGSDAGAAEGQNQQGGQSPDSQSTNNAEHQGEQGEDSNQPDSKEEPKESNYAKAKKNSERFDRNWRRLQEQQQQLARQRAELAAREAALRSQPAPAQPAAQHGTQSSDEDAARYEEAALEWEREGKFEVAELARAQAARLRAQSTEQASAQASMQQVQTSVPQANASGPGSPQFIQTWNENLRAMEAEADFVDLRDRDSALYKATAGVLQEDARFSYFPDGIRVAARIAKLRVEAGAVPELQTKVQAYEQELAKLRAATSPSRGAPNSRGGAQLFDELSMAEQERELMRLAREVDGA